HLATDVGLMISEPPRRSAGPPATRFLIGQSSPYKLLF
ncbi:hypothetical protein A2U01_0112345, partial [Trifolium medium]|nr:hypothetical protein [Trifolium medium]